MKSNLFGGSSSKLYLGRWLGLVWLAGCLLLMGCNVTGDMNHQPYNRPLSASDFFADGRSARPLVEGTVPQTDEQANGPAETGLAPDGTPLKGFPVPVTNDLVKRGQERFDIYCVVCHDPDGHGNGKAIPFGVAKPPDLLGDTVKALDNGDYFKVITEGKGNMFSYAYRVKAPDRWAIIAYLRAMQLKNGHLTEDLTPAELQQIGQ